MGRFKKEKITAQDDEGSVEKKTKVGAQVSGQPITSWIYQPALLSLLLVLGLAVLLEVLFVQSLEQDHQININERYAQIVQRDLNFYASERVTSVSRLAVAISNQEIKEITQLKSTAASLYSDFVSVYLIPQNEVPLVRNDYPELGFASVDLLRKTQPDSATKIETFFQDKRWFYQIATPVLGASGEQTAILMLLFSVDEVAAVVKTHAQHLNGNLSLTSEIGNSRAVMTFGASAVAQSIELPINFGTWGLSYAATDAGLFAVDRMNLWLIVVVSAVLSSVLIFVLCRLRLNRVRGDLLQSTKILTRAVHGEPAKVKELVFAEFITAVQSLVQLIKESKTTGSTPEMQHESPITAMSSTEDPLNKPLFDDELDFRQLDEGNDFPEQGANNDTSQGINSLMTETFTDIPQSIFRAYDIRGIVDETLNEERVEMIGRALASEALSQGQSTLCVGYDGRLSSPLYCEAICRGINSTGADAIVVGLVPTPVLYFATHHLKTGTGVMITGSHNPSNYNGFKMMVAGNTLSGDDIQNLHRRITEGDLAEGAGSRSEQSVSQAYLDVILGDVAVAAPLKVVVDAGNGVAGDLAPKLIEELGCEVIPLFCDIDGNFPNHHPDPGKPENLQDLIAAVKAHDADLGLAFDGDGDRVGVVTNTGKIIWPDRLLMLFAKDVVSRNPGADIIYDVKCSRRLNSLISSYGGRPVMWKTGHSLIKAKMKETGALLAGEMSGHVFFKERWYGFDDGLYSAARLLEILGVEDRRAEEVFQDFPEDVSTPEINIEVTDESKFIIVEKLAAYKASFEDASVSTIDGLRADFANGWGLCRASNTTPMLVLRFEADDEQALEEIKAKFKKQLAHVDSSLDLNF